MDEYTILKYIRLSTEDSINDSMSIENQRTMLDKYIVDMDIPNIKALELVDNGYSGTNFERPGVQELLELVRAGKVNCIIVKDFSRFGRNAIETGYFLERVFPLYRTRFISVCDNYDSAKHEGGTGGIEVALKFLVHEQYSRDLSKKIKAAKAEKARRGEYITKNCAFGFVKTPDKRLDIDPAAADTVRLIFKLASEGKSLSEIERVLYEQKRPTPAAYKKHKRGGMPDTDFEYVWNKSSLHSILRDEQYTGTYVAGKTRAADVGSSNQIKLSESEWVKIPGHHPAIVSAELFDKVQAIIGARKKQASSPRPQAAMGAASRCSPLKGKVVCGYCGHVMAFITSKNASFQCKFTRAVPDAECHGLSMNSGDLESAIFEIISKQAQIALGVDGLSELDAAKLQATRQTECQRSIERLGYSKCDLYERFTLGEVSADEYKNQKNAINSEIDRLNHAYATLTEQLSKRQREADARAKLCDAVSGESVLSQEITHTLIEKVRIYPSGRIEIEWKLADLFDVEH